MYLNSCYEENLDKNFSKAVNLCETQHSRKDLFNFLRNGNMPEKQFAALEIDRISDSDEAEILVSNLTGCDGKIREAVAFKISELIKEYKKYFYPYPEIFANATIDINANISRMIIESLYSLKGNKEFSKKYLECIKDIIQTALIKLDSFVFRDKKYTINKQLFKLYWCLEGLNVFFADVNEAEFAELLIKCSQINEYTIREKVALVLKHNVKIPALLELKQKLKFDINYYVKNV